MKMLLRFTVVLLLISTTLQGQDTVPHTKHHEHAAAIGYVQVKEGLNYGLVFRGPGLLYNGNWFYMIGKNRLSYNVKFNLAYFLAREIEGLSMGIQPLHLAYDFDIKQKKVFFVGPALHAEYNYELYPDLQSGFSFWFTNYSLGADVDYKFEFIKQQLRVKAFTTVLGMTSRPPVYRNPYYFELSAGDAISYLHDDLQFSSFPAFNQTNFELRWQHRASSRLAVAYELSYYGYYDAPKFTLLSQYLKLIIYPKTKKNNEQ